jgi:translation elongation factor EF-1alpha
MIKSIVVFGPADAGKSTLIGRLHAHKHSHLADKIRDEIVKSGQRYDPAQRFAYVTDRYKDERGERKDLSGHGNTRYMKYLKIEIEVQSKTTQMILIDTPGAQHVERERYKGTFFGDAGIFVIEFHGADQSLQQLLARADQISEFLAPLMSWVTIKSDAPFCIVLSKSDTYADDSAARIHQSLDREIRKLLPGKNLVQILPTSIDVKSGGSSNVFYNDAKPAWYSGPSLVEVIERQLTKRSEEASTTQLMMPIVRAVNYGGIGRVYEGRVLSGAFAEADPVTIAPVTAENGETVARAHVRAIYDTAHDSGLRPKMPFARAGDIVGITLSRMASKFEVTRSTVILRQGQRAYRGPIVLVRLLAEAPENLRLMTDVTVVWLGRLMTATVVGICRDGGQLGYYLEAAGEFVVPATSGEEFSLSEVYFRGPLKILMRARLEDVGHASQIVIHDSVLMRQLRSDLPALKEAGLESAIDSPDRLRVQPDARAASAIAWVLRHEPIRQNAPPEQEKSITLLIGRTEL